MEKLSDNPSVRAESQIRGSQGRWGRYIAYVEASGTTIIEHKDTSVRYEIDAEDVYWDLVDASDRSMGSELRYEGTIEHPELGVLTWSLWEYPVGIQNYKDRDIGDHQIIQEFEFGLEHEPDCKRSQEGTVGSA